MSEQNVEQSDGALPVQDIEGVHADPADLPDQVELAARRPTYPAVRTPRGTCRPTIGTATPTGSDHLRSSR
jgi:hypothetical protein